MRWPRRRRRGGSPFAGWTMLAVAGLAVFLSGPAQTYGVSVFIDPMLTEFGWSRSLMASSYSLATLFSAGALFLVGRQLDRVGHRLVLAVTAFGFGGALLLMSVVNQPLMLVVGFTLLRTCGSGVLTLTARTLVPQWFVRRRGRALSLLGLGSTLSLAIIPPVNGFLIELVGWRDAWRIAAAVIWLVLLPAVALLVRNRPEEIGQRPDGERPTATGDGERPAPAGADEEDAWTLRQAMRVRPFWFLVAAGVVPSLVVTGLSFHQVSIFTSRDLPATLAATTFTVESLVGLPMTFLAGWLVDRFPPRFALAGAQAALALGMGVLLFADSPLLALIYAGFRGASMGMFMVAADALWPTYFGRRYLGSIRGMTFAVGIVGAAIGPLPFGFIFDAFGRYDYTIAGLLVLPVVATMLVLRATPPGRLSTA